MAGQDAGGEGALQRGEAEDSVGIAAEDELVQPVTESADAVVEEDGVGHVTAKTLASCEIKGPTLSLQKTERQAWATA